MAKTISEERTWFATESAQDDRATSPPSAALRGQDLNLRPLAYGPALGCGETPRHSCQELENTPVGKFILVQLDGRFFRVFWGCKVAKW